LELPLSFDPNIKTHYSTIPAVNTGSGIGITVSCKDVDGVLQFINDLLSNEVEILRNWGEKDIDYNVDDKGSFYRTDEQRNNQKNQDWDNANMCPYGGFPGYAQGYLDDGINCIIASH
jgi:putative aldouronate transport system substrate-binding protein